jgi:enoyl-CoA hydratase/carnithine racemase
VSCGCLSPAAVTACLSAVTRGINLPIDEALAVEASWFAFAAATGDVSAGLHRFLTRKRP